MESIEFRLQRLEDTLAVVRGTDMALQACVNLLLAFHKGNPQAIAGLELAFEGARVALLHSDHESKRQEQAFEEIAATVLGAMR